MRRWFLIAIVALLAADASGVTSLAVPETCGITLSDQSPDGGCPAFCARCSCCATPVLSSQPAVVPATMLSHPRPLDVNSLLPVGRPLDILHVPKTLLA